MTEVLTPGICPACDGKGHHTFRHNILEGVTWQPRCEVCNGTGQATPLEIQKAHPETPLCRAAPEMLAALQDASPKFKATWERTRKDLQDQSGSGYDISLANQLAIAGWSAAAFWYFFPAGILRKHDIRPDIFSRMIIWLYENDHENNTIPSSHVFHAIICSYFLALAYSSYVLLFATIGFFVAISTVFVKQHHAADILGGMVWALASISIASYIVG